MYQVTINGRNLEELKKAVLDISEELTSGIISGAKVEKALDKVEEVSTLEEVPVQESLAPLAPMTKEEVPDVSINDQPHVVVEGAELDSEDLPWDRRIHTIKKTKVKAGTWKIKKGTDPNIVTKIKTDLRVAMELAANPPVIPAPPITPALVPVIEQEPIYTAPSIANDTPTLEPASPRAHVVDEIIPREMEVPPVIEPPMQTLIPVAPPQPMSASGHTIHTFKENFPMIIADLITREVLTQKYIEQLNAYFKVSQIAEVSDAQKEILFDNFVTANFISKAG